MKCPKCGTKMKIKPGLWESAQGVLDWWYCPNCGKMIPYN